jgi:hypothetical protein
MLVARSCTLGSLGLSRHDRPNRVHNRSLHRVTRVNLWTGESFLSVAPMNGDVASLRFLRDLWNFVSPVVCVPSESREILDAPRFRN